MARIVYGATPWSKIASLLRRSVWIAKRKRLKNGLDNWRSLGSRDRACLWHNRLIVDALFLSTDRADCREFDHLRDLVTLKAQVNGQQRYNYPTAVEKDIYHYVAMLRSRSAIAS